MERLNNSRLLTWNAFVVAVIGRGEYREASWWRVKAASSEDFKALVRDSIQAQFGGDVELSFGPVTGSSGGPWEF